MIKVDNSLLKLRINADKIVFGDYFRPVMYSYFNGKIPTLGMVVKKSHTIQIDLKQSEEDILQGFKSNTRNEVRRAIREGFFFDKNVTEEEFVNYYNDFANEKGLAPINLSHITKYGKNVMLCKSGLENTTMTMHATIIDDELKKAMLLYSASIRLDQGVDKKNVGFSNRYLHYMEFVELKRMGYELYDFSGVCIDPNEKEKYSIGLFKKGFGGVECDFISLKSYPMALALWLKGM